MTPQPISRVEGAAVIVRWIGHEFGPPGLEGGSYNLEVAETLSDKDGDFIIPKYPSTQYEMAVYKAGYVCWGKNYIMHPGGKTEKDLFEEREDFCIGFGMKIRLEPFKKEWPRGRHAIWVSAIATSCGVKSSGTIFGKAIEEEEILNRKVMRGEQ